MKLIQGPIVLTGLFLGLILCSLQGHAGMAGQVILTKGMVSAVSDTGEARILKRRSKIMSGDLIKTGPAGSVQIRFIDKALMTIKANSEMDITAYQLAKPDENKSEKALMRLVKGGFRTISGKIGKGDKSAYRVDTPAASIGIRGTNYEVQQEANGDFVMAVYSGGISVQNESGSIQLGLGGDFNFTRVSGNNPPKGLLIAPETLSENSATNETQPEEKEEIASNDSDGTTDGQSDDDADGKTEGTEATDSLEEGEIDDASGSSTLAGSDEPDEAIASLADTSNPTETVDQNASAALDEALTDALQENKEDFEATVVAELIEQGYLTEGETLDALDSTVLDNLEALGSLDNLEEAETIDLSQQDIIDEEDPLAAVDPANLLFIDGLYSGLVTANNPFPNSFINDAGVSYDLITQEEYNLVASNKLAMMVMPMEFTQAANGDLSFNFGEAHVTSATALADAAYATSYTAAEDATINVSFTVLNTTTNQTDQYDVRIPINVAITDPSMLLTEINTQLSSGYLDIQKNGVQINTTATSYPITELLVSLDTSDPGYSKFSFAATTGSDEFMTKLELNFSGTDADLLTAMLGGDTASNNDNWYSQADIETFIASGAWELSADGNGNPILVMSDTRDDNGTTLVRNEIIKLHPDTEITDSLLSFALCGDAGKICSIQVNKDNDNIRWGAWLAEPGKGIQIFEQTVNADGSINSQGIHEEDQILAFWLAAERADINTLSGTANFSSSSLDCLDFSQCIGFADDGLVQTLTGNFDVNFNTGAITNGNLTIDVSDTINASLLGGAIPGTVSSTWDVNFSGQMASDQPEFITNSINGTVSGTTTSNSVIGNIGGIFVKPGDIFAGGYNLGTADGTNKHVSGVFTLDKQP
jgi:hypothetical protein